MNAIYLTFRIFIWSIPFLLALASLTLLNLNPFFGLWLLSSYDYPFSYAIALFISLLCSVILLWTIQKNNKDYSPIILGLCILIGCMLKLSTNTQIESFIVGLFYLSAGLFLLAASNSGRAVNPELITYIANTINMIYETVSFYSFPLIFVFIGCSFKFYKPVSISKRLFYAAPAIFTIIFISFITFKTSVYNPTPGLIIPNQLRHFWGMKQFSNQYQKAIEEIKYCPAIAEMIGEIQNTGLAEGKNSWSMDFNGDDWATISLKLVGSKGTTIIKGCDSDNFCNYHKYEDHSTNSEKKLYYGECLN